MKSNEDRARDQLLLAIACGLSLVIRFAHLQSGGGTVFQEAQEELLSAAENFRKALDTL